MFRTEDALVEAFVAGLAELRPWGVEQLTREFFYLRGRTDVVGVIAGGNIIAFEAKLARWKDALHQAYRNTCFAHWSFVVVPPKVAQIAVRSLAEFERRKVGLCTVVAGEVVVLYEPPWALPIQPWLSQYAVATARSASVA